MHPVEEIGKLDKNQPSVLLHKETSVANYIPSIIRDDASEKNLSQEVRTVTTAVPRSTNETQNTSRRNITKV